MGISLTSQKSRQTERKWKHASLKINTSEPSPASKGYWQKEPFPTDPSSGSWVFSTSAQQSFHWVALSFEICLTSSVGYPPTSPTPSTAFPKLQNETSTGGQQSCKTGLGSGSSTQTEESLHSIPTPVAKGALAVGGILTHSPPESQGLIARNTSTGKKLMLSYLRSQNGVMHRKDGHSSTCGTILPLFKPSIHEL